jgi:hypothetical protein
VKDHTLEKTIKKFNSTGLFDSKKNMKEDSKTEFEKAKIKKPEPKPRSKTPVSRNKHTQSSINLHDKAKSIKPPTDRGKKLANLTIDDAFKTEKDSPKVYIS